MTSWLGRIRRWVEVAAAGFLAVMTVLTLAAVIARYVFNSSLPDAFDLARLAQGVAVLWGIALTTYDGRHITVDILYERLSASGRRQLDLVATAIVLAFLAVVAWMSLLRAFESMASGLSTNELRIPVWPFWMLAVFGLTASVLTAAIRLHMVAKARQSSAQ